MEVLTMTTFGERLRSLRKNETSLTMKELGKRIGVSESAVGMYERGEREPDMEVIGRIADLFEVTVDYLLGRSDQRDYTAAEDEKFNRFKDDPTMERWFNELPKTKEEDLRKLKKMWDLIKDNH